MACYSHFPPQILTKFHCPSAQILLYQQLSCSSLSPFLFPIFFAGYQMGHWDLQYCNISFFSFRMVVFPLKNCRITALKTLQCTVFEFWTESCGN